MFFVTGVILTMLSNSRRMAMMSASFARRASICLWAASCGPRTDNFPSITHQPITWTLFRVLLLLEDNGTYINQNPKCEPQLGKRGLYRALGGVESRVDELAMLWVLNLSDGKHSLLDIAERSGSAFDVINRAADALLEHALLKPIVA